MNPVARTLAVTNSSRHQAHHLTAVPHVHPAMRLPGMAKPTNPVARTLAAANPSRHQLHHLANLTAVHTTVLLSELVYR